ncbi:similar to Saccharomyces cerevisiae YGR218W CRM1 Major karyopherin, involved in export of proteins, RNAs, and ribosomal subunits from the nucleus [Maudiozyma saulgeensis]|uniref:Exportin-1 n=1 Tax=Maudiozyma saulgeensis TaxID=1789683 RepID=A0A1X7R5Q1_9SACH|nr:similar to Saccharomyces cerevisiae YGR218W CRM1 Major karyopherin, involved in export of proteins, RNAs, and ribosomal subunits from the nucleus [Kazachstania saulgeensis]
MATLSNLRTNFDIDLLDEIVDTFYNGTGQAQQNAQRELTSFQDDPASWTKADKILQFSKNNNTRFIALSILDKLIKTRWKSLPEEQSVGIRNFIVGMIISLVQEEARNGTLTDNQLIHKCDLTLVEILKQEWPDRWPDFIPELIKSSTIDINLCENNLVILKLLYEEIFDYSSGHMTQAKATRMKKSMSKVCLQIYMHIIDILKIDEYSATLELSALECLLDYLEWIPPEYIFESNILQLLSLNYIKRPETRNVTIKCLTTITSVTIPKSPQHITQMVESFIYVLKNLTAYFPPASSGLKLTYASSNFVRQQFFQDLTTYLTKFLKVYREKLEVDNAELRTVLLTAHEYLVQLTRIDETEIFKTCLDYWHELTSALFVEIQQYPIADLLPSLELSFEMKGSGAMNPQILKQIPLKKHIYEEICSQLRKIIITEKMIRPEEIIVVKDIDSGEVVREVVNDSEMLDLYYSEKETLVYLTYLDFDDTERIIMEELERQMSMLKMYTDGEEDNQNGWAWDNLNCLCWSIGSIPSTISEESENIFIKSILDKLTMIKDARITNSNDRALFDSNVMYIVGQYPRFMKNHWQFLLQIIGKLFQCMHDANEGIQDMACDTFSKIVSRCKYQFVINKPEDATTNIPLIKSIIDNMSDITSDLTQSQLTSFYKSCASIVKEERNYDLRYRLLSDLMKFPNATWKSILNIQLEVDTDDKFKALAKILDVNIAVCESIGRHFASQLEQIHLDLVGLYGVASECIQNEIKNLNVQANDTSKIRACRSIKKKILLLQKLFISDLNGVEFDKYLSPLLKLFLDISMKDYNSEPINFKEPEVLLYANSVILNCGQRYPDIVVIIIENTFLSSLEMIKNDTDNFPDHRLYFYQLLRTITYKNFPVLIEFPTDGFFNMFFDTICWSFKHHNREIEETGLQIAIDMLNNVDRLNDNTEFQAKFYEIYYLKLINEILYAITDSDHQPAFAKQALLFRNLLMLSYDNRIPVSLVNTEGISGNFSNTIYLNEYITKLLTTAFPNLTVTQIESFLNALMKNYNNVAIFTNTVSDFIIQSKEIGADPTDYFYDEETP